MTISPINNQAEQWTDLNIAYSFLVTPKKQSLCSKHKTLIGIAVSLATLAAAAFYAYMSKPGNFYEKPKPGCVDRYYDDLTNSICINGEFTPSLNKDLPDYSRFAKLIEECASGAQIPGCLDGKFYRELTQECKNNPAAALCDGKYDYQEFLKKIDRNIVVAFKRHEKLAKECANGAQIPGCRNGEYRPPELT